MAILNQPRHQDNPLNQPVRLTADLLAQINLEQAEPECSVLNTEETHQQAADDVERSETEAVSSKKEPFSPEIPENFWQNACELLKSQLSLPSFETWIQPLELLAVNPDNVVLAASSGFMRDWVLRHYRGVMQEAFSTALGSRVDIQIIAQETLKEQEKQAQEKQALENSTSGFDNASESEARSDRKSTNEKSEPKSTKERSWTPRSTISNLNPRYTFDQFVVGTNNRFCHAAALAVAETPAQSYNPFFIHGGVGLGKTHLMHAIGHFVLAHHPGMKVRYVTAEKFTNELIASLANKEMKAFRDRYRKIDVLMIDDVQFLEGKNRTQEEVFHTFNALHESCKQIILSSDRSPQLLTNLEDRLRSRFEWGLITDIQPADYETRLMILKQKCQREHLLVPEDVLEFVAETHPNNIRELEGSLNKITAYAMLTKTILDLDLARQVFGASAPVLNLSPDRILSCVAKYYHLEANDLKSPSRAKDVSHARQIAIYVLRTLTEASFPKIGELLGGRKHTTILYAYEKVKAELDTHPALSKQVKELMSKAKS